MPKYQGKNKTKNSTENMSPLESCHSTSESPEYSNTGEVQENNLKINIVKIIDILKEQMNKYLNHRGNQ